MNGSMLCLIDPSLARRSRSLPKKLEVADAV
jgi:hypothetical protein